MLIEPMIHQLYQLRLRGMAAGLEQLLHSAQHQSLSFEERLSVMIQHEIIERDSKRLAQRLRWCVFHAMPVARFAACRSPISRHAGRSFHVMPVALGRG